MGGRRAGPPRVSARMAYLRVLSNPWRQGSFEPRSPACACGLSSRAMRWRFSRFRVRVFVCGPWALVCVQAPQVGTPPAAARVPSHRRNSFRGTFTRATACKSSVNHRVGGSMRPFQRIQEACDASDASRGYDEHMRGGRCIASGWELWMLCPPTLHTRR